MKTVLDVIRLLGVSFAGDAWLVFLRALFALPMTDEDVATFNACTGRATPPSAPCREAWMVVGRRGGKSRVAALLAVFLACFRRYKLAPGERGVVMVIAADRRQARVVLRYVIGLLESHPMTAALITKKRKEGVELSGGIDIEIHTASYKTTRGYTVVAAILDEIAFWETSDDAAQSDSDIVNAIRPAMATVDSALLVGLSSPYARRGELWKNYQRHFGHDSPVLVWQAATRVMNPSVPQSVIDAAVAEDEAAAAAEYGAQFRRDIEAFLSREAIAAVTMPGRRELPVREDVEYVAFADPSGGSSDSFTLAIAHLEGDRAVLDLVRERKPPFSPDDVVREFSNDLKLYRVSEVVSDRYAGSWPIERWRAHGIDCKPATQTRSDLYLSLLPMINSGRVELLDDERLVKQLTALERRTSRGGKDSVDHGPGGHDDRANAAAGALVVAGTVTVGPQIRELFGREEWAEMGGVFRW